MSNNSFLELGLSEKMVETLMKKGFEQPSKIQSLVIPEFLKQKSNIIGQAQTGTGKTAAFAIPIIETLIPTGQVKALILTPTRELANQVSDEIYSLTTNHKLKVYPIYGGQSIEQQIRNIKNGVDIIVGTPGRIVDLMDRKVLDFTTLEYFILDEADEMLNMGFVESIEEILKKTNPKQRMLFFSATMPSSILNIAKKYMKDFKTLKVDHKENVTDLTEQIYFELRDSEKFDTLCRVIDYEKDFYGIVFVRTKRENDDITNKLKARGYSVDSLHGDISQVSRNKTLANFKSKVINILIATDVAARGIDVNNLSHVINYSVPEETESYIHRIGRTGRAGNKGIAITFITKKDSYLLNRIQKMAKTNIVRHNAPTVSEVVASKRESLIAFVKEVIDENDYKPYLDLASTILDNNDPKVVLAALIRHAYNDEYLETNYAKINNSSSFSSDYSSEDTLKDEIRLFVALGKNDGFNSNKLLKFLNEECKTPARKVRNIKILEKFSFITVSFDEAEIILKVMQAKKQNKPLITRAKK